MDISTVSSTAQNANMATTNTTLDVKEMLPFETFHLHVMDVVSSCSPLLLTTGVVANILNVVVFAKTRCTDNMTVSLIALSVSDLTYLLLISPHAAFSCADHVLRARLKMQLSWGVEPMVLRIPFYWYAFVFYETSILITVYISVVRCACVAMPFRVASTFTSGRAIVAFLVFFISVFLLRLPMLITRRIVLEFDAASNSSRLVYRKFDDGGVADTVNDIVSRNVLPWASFIIVVTSVIIMVSKLRASAKFRSSSSSSAPQTTESTETTSFTNSASTPYNPHFIDQSGQSPKNTRSPRRNRPPRPLSGRPQLQDTTNTPRQTLNVSKDQSSHRNTPLEEIKPPKTTDGTKPSSVSETRQKKSNSSNNRRGQDLTNREAQVVKSVVLIACIFITCQLPFMMYSLARRLEPEFNVANMTSGKPARYYFVFTAVSNFSKLFAYTNASVNIFVYYNFNSRYRQCLKQLFK